MDTNPVPTAHSPVWADDSRTPPPLEADERSTLSAYLDWHRATLELKCAHVPPERLAEQVVAPSTISLHGLIRHLAGNERWWFRMQFAGEVLPMLYYSDADPDQDFEFAHADPAVDLDVWRAECELSRAIVAAAPSMDSTGTRIQTGETFSLRWLMLRMIAEYAQHNGHADLVRERIDGAVGL
jgi:Protein of unknown function (DUF664)